MLLKQRFRLSHKYESMEQQKKYRIILADDHLLIRRGLTSLLLQEPELEVVGEASDGEQLLTLLEKQSADLLILDISMPKIDGLEIIRRAKKKNSGLKFLVLTMHANRDYLLQVLGRGGHGYLLKDDSASELLQAIAAIRAGKKYICSGMARDDERDELQDLHQEEYSPFTQLTLREKEVLRLVIMGKTSRDIADNLGVSARTIDHHRASLLRKFNMRNSIDLVNYAIRQGYFSK